MNPGYRLFIEEDGGIKVKVAKEVEPLKYEVIWMFGLDGKDEPVILNEFYTPGKFLVMDWNGHLRAYDADKKKKIFERDFEADLDCRGIVSQDGGKLYISHSHDYKDHTLTVYSLEDFSIIAEHVLPQPINLEWFKERTDGKLLYYYHDWKYKGEEKIYTHGYQVIDPVTGKNKHFALPFPPKEMFEKKVPVIDKKQNIGIMQDWDNIEIKTGPDGDPRFIEKLVFFDLDNFQILRIVPVREYRANQIDCFEKARIKHASALMKGPGDDKYNEAMKTLMENLNTIHVNENEDSFWLCWRAGVLRKVAIDGSYISPMFVVSKLPGYGSDLRPFEFTTFHSHLEEVHEDHLVLSGHSDHLIFPIKGLDFGSSEEYIPIELLPFPEEKKIKIIVPGELKKREKELGKVVIAVEDLDEKESVLDGLDQMVNLTKDIASIRDGWKLVFLVKDKKGKNQDDEEFFKKAVKIEGAPEKIREVIENFIQYPDAEELYIHEEATALCYAAENLALHDPKYIDTTLQYLAVMDFEHDVYCSETLIPNLIEKYSETPYEPRLRIGVAMTDSMDASDFYLLDEFLNEDSYFRKWFDNGGAEQVAGIVEELEVFGLRSTYLFHEPGENLVKLQQAIEGDIAAIAAGLSTATINPSLLGWNYLKHINNPGAGKDLLGNDVSTYDEPHLRLLVFAGLANMLTFDIIDDRYIKLREIENPKVKELLPNPVDFSKVGGLMHRIESESFLRLPGLMQFEGMDFVIDYLTSTRIEPEEVEVLRRESWNMKPADLLINLPGIFYNRVEDILYFMQPPFHSKNKINWSDWMVRMKMDPVLQFLTPWIFRSMLTPQKPV